MAISLKKLTETAQVVVILGIIGVIIYAGHMGTPAHRKAMTTSREFLKSLPKGYDATPKSNVETSPVDRCHG
ncbi:hypothetical protein G3A43_08145 [Paraburkholderia aspalathi]|nr:hypothetical protein [Paraburkholderia aspalathi]MBK3780226.1 hypothetical protein [Paraburkholderia aspalathi]